jgi:uncharacterized iron-regulated membrane protein
MTLKKISGKIHLWLGFIAGLVVLISLLAAAVFVWEKELNDWYHHDKIFVKEVRQQRLPFNMLLEKAKAVSYDRSITLINIERDASRAFVFGNYKAAKEKGWTWASGVDDYSKIFINQYTGEVLGKIDMRYDWIFCMRMLHQCLLLNYDVGHYIVGGATVIIFIMVVTGIVLWWPRNKAALKQRTWFRWKDTTKWKRKNYDLHNIGGIYSFFFILIFALTGLVWTFDWWEDTIYRMLGNEPKKVWRRAPAPPVANYMVSSRYDSAISDAMRRVPTWKLIGLNMPPAKAKAMKEIAVYVKYSSGASGWDESNNYAYHPQTGKLYFSTIHDQKTLGAKWRNSNYAIHVGSIYGLPTKLLATFIALFCASLPVTGFYIWWGRRKKKNRRTNIFPGSEPQATQAEKKIEVIS